MKKITALLLLLALLIPAAACGSTGGTAETTATEAPAVVTDPLATEEDTAPRLELPEKKFGGTVFTVLCEKWSTYTPFDYTDIVAEEQNGETLNDATLKRLNDMRETYDCDVAMVQVENGKALGAIQTAVTSGDKLYDIFLARGTRMTSAVTDGYLEELSQYEELDTEKPWWEGNSRDALSVRGKTFGLIGLTSTNYMRAVWIECFNKSMIADNNLENPYELVKDGKWTLEKMLGMSAAVTRDADGDGTMGPQDIWGANYTRDCVTGLLNSCGVDLGAKGADGEIVITVNESANVERMTDVLSALFGDPGSVDTLSATGAMKAKVTDGEFFANGNVLFLLTATHGVEALRQMNIEFGLLPYPKFAEDDVRRSCVGGNFITISTIPVCAVNAEDSAYFMEAFTYEGYVELLPAFYNIILQGRLAPDVDSSETLEFIFNDLWLDPVYLYNFGTLPSNINGLSITKNTNVASMLKSYMNIAQKALDAFNASVGG